MGHTEWNHSYSSDDSTFTTSIQETGICSTRAVKVMDKRINVTTEAFEGIKLIKLQAGNDHSYNISQESNMMK